MKKKQIDKSVKETRAERNEARRYAEQLKCERDEARAAYEAETAGTIELCKRIMQLEAEVNHWRNKHSELFMAANPIATDCPPADTGYACDYARHKRDVPCGICPLKSQREAVGTADGKPEGQAENDVSEPPPESGT